MISKFTLLNCLLLVSAALAVPSSRPVDRLARRDRNRRSKPLSHVTPSADIVVEDNSWAGAVLAGADGTFSLVEALFTAPNVTSSNGSASIWVGIDGAQINEPACENVILQTGIDFSITEGLIVYQAWYQWYPSPAVFWDISLSTLIKGGDLIKAAVTLDNKTSGMVYVRNFATDEIYWASLGDPSHPLCGASAEWIVEDYTDNGVTVPFANFSKVTFTNTHADGPNGERHTASGANISEIVHNGIPLTSVTIEGDNVTIQYI